MAGYSHGTTLLSWLGPVCYNCYNLSSIYVYKRLRVVVRRANVATVAQTPSSQTYVNHLHTEIAETFSSCFHLCEKPGEIQGVCKLFFKYMTLVYSLRVP